MLNRELAEIGVKQETVNASKVFDCPKCGRKFSLFQSRAIACRSCPMVNKSCGYVRCIHCDAEFPLESLSGLSGEDSRRTSDHMGRVVDGYYENMGYRKA